MYCLSWTNTGKTICWRSIHDIQTVITCTGLDEFVNNRFSINRIFHIKNGNAAKCELGGKKNWVQSGTEFEILIWGLDHDSDTGGAGSSKKKTGYVHRQYLLTRTASSVYEIVDNSVDEALAGYCDEIQVDINKDNSVTVSDNGRGIPVGINHKAGLPAVEVVFTILHAGGKIRGGGYKYPEVSTV